VTAAFRILRPILIVVAAFAALLFALWAALALWYRLPAPPWAAAAAAGGMALAGLATAALVFTRRRWRALAAFAVLGLAVLGWWSTIRPPAVADFAPDVARQTTGVLAGDRLNLKDVRNFAWRGEYDGAERWEERSYDLTALRHLDLFLSTWDDSGIAHMIMSFGFADGRWLAWSVEVKRLNGSVYSPIAAAFKENAIAFVAAEELDVIGVRTNFRGENVARYRLNLRQETIRTVLLEFVAQANALAREPRFYNSLTTNCTTAVVAMMRATGATLPLDWRLLLNTAGLRLRP
jgi:hypothetical protein